MAGEVAGPRTEVAPAVDLEEWRTWCSRRTDQGFLAQELADYARDGICIVRNAVPAALLAEAKQHVAWLAEHNPGRRPEHFDMMYGDPFWHRLVSDPALLDIAEQFVGPDIALFQTHWIAKPPGDGLPVLYHQDGGRVCQPTPHPPLVCRSNFMRLRTRSVLDDGARVGRGTRPNDHAALDLRR